MSKLPKLIDVHTHAQFAAYENPKEIVDRALESDTWLVNVGTQIDTSKAAVKLANEYKEGVYAAIGLHPIHTDASFHDEKELGGGEAAKAFTSRGEQFDYDLYKEIAVEPKVVAIGECGLDYYRLSEETKSRQFKAFESQIRLSKDVNKPLMIHCRNAFADLISVLKTYRGDLLELPGIIHFFSGTKEDAKALMELGFSFSLGGVTTFVRDYDEVIKYIGMDRIVLETDAPYVTPVPFRGKRNEPSYVTCVADAIGRILNLDPKVVAEKTTANAKNILKI